MSGRRRLSGSLDLNQMAVMHILTRSHSENQTKYLLLMRAYPGGTAATEQLEYLTGEERSAFWYGRRDRN